MTNHPRQLGLYGESLAAQALERQGWQILHKNFRHIGTEIDIIARKARTLIVVEVKTMKGKLQSPLEDYLRYRKIKSISRGVSQYLLVHQPEEIDTIRLDLVLVNIINGTRPSIRWWPDAAELHSPELS